jgi:hypothetical protein
MTNEQVVLDKINNNRFLGKSKLHFVEPSNEDYYFRFEYENELRKYNERLAGLKSTSTVKDRVNAIINFKFKTYDERNRYQCHANARRSTLDIWRIYKYYFDEVDVFTIMRALYELTIKERLVSTYRCSTVRKRVFWPYRDYGWIDKYVGAELGIGIDEWERIGLDNEQVT